MLPPRDRCRMYAARGGEAVSTANNADARFVAAVEAIYDAAPEPSRWPAALQAIADELRSSSVTRWCRARRAAVTDRPDLSDRTGDLRYGLARRLLLRRPTLRFPDLGNAQAVGPVQWIHAEDSAPRGCGMNQGRVGMLRAPALLAALGIAAVLTGQGRFEHARVRAHSAGTGVRFYIGGALA